MSEFDETVDGLYHGLDIGRHVRREIDRDAVVSPMPTSGSPHSELAFGLAMRRSLLGIVSTAHLGDPSEPAFVGRLRTVTSQHIGYPVGMGTCGDECLFEVVDDPADFDPIGPDPCEECREELEDRDSPLLPDDWRVRPRDPPQTGDAPDL